MAEIFDEMKERRKVDGFRGYRCKGEIFTHIIKFICISNDGFANFTVQKIMELK